MLIGFQKYQRCTVIEYDPSASLPNLICILFNKLFDFDLSFFAIYLQQSSLFT